MPNTTHLILRLFAIGLGANVCTIAALALAYAGRLEASTALAIILVILICLLRNDSIKLAAIIGSKDC